MVHPFHSERLRTAVVFSSSSPPSRRCLAENKRRAGTASSLRVCLLSTKFKKAIEKQTNGSREQAEEETQSFRQISPSLSLFPI